MTTLSFQCVQDPSLTVFPFHSLLPFLSEVLHQILQGLLIRHITTDRFYRSILYFVLVLIAIFVCVLPVRVLSW